MKRLALSGVVFLGALVFAGGGVGSAGAQAPPKVSIMVGGLEKIIYLPAMLTERLGYFKEAGVDVTLYNEAAGCRLKTRCLPGAWTASLVFMITLSICNRKASSSRRLSSSTACRERRWP